MTTSEIISASSAIVQAITTVVLVVITYKQMKHAGKANESMERSIKADFLPILTLSFTAHTSTEKTLNIQLTNCGKGLARKVKIIFPGQADIVVNPIDVSQTETATIEYNIDYILTKISQNERKIIIEYHDVFDRKIVTEANLIEYNKLGTSGDKKGIAWDSWTPIMP